MFPTERMHVTAANLLLSAAYFVFAALSFVLAVIDIRTHRLPDRIVLPGALLLSGLLLSACVCGADWRRLGGAALGGAALFAFHLVLRVLSPAGMGGGDVKLAAVVGLMLGWSGWPAVALGALAGFGLGGLAGIALLLTRRGDRSTRIPFAPFMLSGAWVVIVAGAVQR